MKHIIFTISILVIFSCAKAQKSPTEEAQPIVEEGKRLYRSELASWHGTDLFLEKFNDRNRIGGYLSYVEDDRATCIFYTSGENPVVIGTIVFQDSISPDNGVVDLTERALTDLEKDYHFIRQKALEVAQKDDLFKFYENTNPNFIPVIDGKERKVYILTGTTRDDVVIFGNDYLITFDSKNKVKKKVAIHQSLITININGEEGEDESKKQVGAMHTHLPETGDFITATDICTLMLYEKFTSWEQHTVVSKKYLSIWDCRTDELMVIPMSTVKKINEDVEKRKNKDQ